MYSNKIDNIPWVEKYRPKKVKNIISQKEVINSLDNVIKNKNLPHLLFHGPPGIGKTTTALALCYQLFGDIFDNRVLELNASDDRGIEIVRKKIKTFATLSVNTLQQNNQYPPFKIIILDEVDNMTQDAQAALRRIMEKYCHITRIILICNYITHIIEPINSRCVKFRFKHMDSNLIDEYLNEICSLENYEIDNKTISTITYVSNGDLRRAIMILQVGIMLYGTSLSKSHVLDIAGNIQNNLIEDIFNQCQQKNLNNASILLNKTLSYGFTGNQILLQLSNFLFTDKKQLLSNKKYGYLSMVISKADYKITCGAEPKFQLLEVIGTIIDNIN